MDFIPEVTPRNISNSEVTSFLSCKRMYNFAFVQDLAPINTAPALSRGTLFHYAMELYFQAKMEGHSHDAAMRIAEDAFLNPSEPTPVEVIMEVQFLWMNTMINNQVLFDSWEPLGTEVQMDLPITPTLNITIKYDLYLKEKATGRCFILDWKTTYDFWAPQDHDLNGQMPKYIAVLQANGYQCDGGKLFEVRTRKLSEAKMRDASSMWRITDYYPSYAKKQAVLKQHIAASKEIEAYRALSPEERMDVSLPVLNKYGPCKYCSFFDLCNSMNEGKKDLSTDIRVGYTTSTYGYNKENASVDF